MSFDKKSHWDGMYAIKKPEEVSWYQIEPAVSLELISSTGVGYADKIIDVGSGSSVLVDKLLNQGFHNLVVLDISSKALEYAKERLGSRVEMVKWIVADVTDFKFLEKYKLWHDRAVFHFLTDKSERKKYVQNMDKALHPGGHVIIASFSINGPLKCSGLDVERYSSEKMERELGGSFEFVKSVDEVHMTPAGKEQKFTYFYFKKIV